MPRQRPEKKPNSGPRGLVTGSRRRQHAVGSEFTAPGSAGRPRGATEQRRARALGRRGQCQWAHRLPRASSAAFLGSAGRLRPVADRRRDSRISSSAPAPSSTARNGDSRGGGLGLLGCGEAASERVESGARRPREPQTRASASQRYGVMGCGGITETHWLGGVRSGLAGTCVGSRLARISSAAREQFPPGMFHQLDDRRRERRSSRCRIGWRQSRMDVPGSRRDC